MRGCFLDAGSVGSGLDWSTLEQSLEAWHWHDNSDPANVALRLRGADVAVTNKVVLDAATLEAADRLRLICIAATGTNNVDLNAARDRDIPVLNVTGYATDAVCQHVYAMLLALATRWTDYNAAVRRGDWSRSQFFCLLDYPIVELAGKTLGIVGHGALGARVAALGKAFGMHVLLSERPGAAQTRPERHRFEDVLEQSDVISLHCPLTPDTRQLIDERALGRMKTGAFLINTARGGLIDSASLAEALKSHRIAGAAIDVLEDEPPPVDHPLLADDIPNLIVTPHSAWASHGARQRVIDRVAAHIEAFRQGATPNRVNP